MKRSGVADLPLHGGRVPAWLAGRMTKPHENKISSSLGGRSVFDDKPRQGSLF
ncbi:MAG: hypothetical protein WAV47_25555 [Blastocatellia bacterium]